MKQEIYIENQRLFDAQNSTGIGCNFIVSPEDIQKSASEYVEEKFELDEIDQENNSEYMEA